MSLLQDGLVLAGAGIAFASVFTQATWRALASHRWPTAPAEVERLDVLDGVNVSRGGVSLMQAPEVLYRYHIRGAVYRGTKLWFGPEPAWSGRWLRRRLADGAPLCASYDPKRPHIAVLRPGITPVLGGYLALAAVAFGWGVYWAVAALLGGS